MRKNYNVFAFIESIEILIMLLLVGTSAFCLIQTDFMSLSANKIINLSLDFLAMLFCLFIYASISREVNTIPINRTAFMVLTYLEFLTLVADLFAKALNGMVQYANLNFINNTILFLAGNILPLCFYVYIRTATKYDDKSMESLDTFAILVAFISFTMTTTNIFTGLYFKIIDGYMVNTYPLVYGQYVLAFAALFISFGPIFKCKLDIMEKFALVSYMYVPIVMMIIHILVDDLALMYVGVSISLIIIYTQFYRRHSRMVVEQRYELAEQQSEISNQKAKLMLSQVQPHFVYNGLLSIRSMIKRSPNEAKVAIDDFSAYLLGSLERLEMNGLIPLGDEIEFTVNYLHCEQVRYGDDISYELDVEPIACKLPPISIQPFVESAIENGIRRKQDGKGKVSLKVHQADGNVHVSIEDDGVGFNALEAEDSTIEYVAIKHALTLLKKFNGSVDIVANSGVGTKVEVIFPITK